MIAAIRRPLPAYLLLCACVALWIDLSRIHLGQTSDSLIPVLVSLQHWTPFYWEQSRFGMLLPLLATPFENPLVNLLVQNGLMIFAGLAAIGLLTRFFVRSRVWFIAACGSCIVFLTCLAEPLRCDYLIAQPYGVSFSLGLGALLALDRASTRMRWSLALFMIVLAGWVNLAVGPALLLIALSRWAGQRFRPRQAPWRLVVLILVGILAGVAFESLAPYRDAHVTRLAPLSRWLPACESLVENALAQSESTYCGALALLTAVAVLTILLTSRRRQRVALWALVSFFVASFALVLLAGASRWTARNDFMPRYIYMALLAAQTGVIAAFTIAIRGLNLGERRSVSATWIRLVPRRAYAASLALFLAVGFTYGVPSLETARVSLDSRLGVDAGAIPSNCTHIAGVYWRVWPAVFHANWKRYATGDTRVIWGVAYRSAPTTSHWAPREFDPCRVVMLGHDPRADQLLHRHFSFAFVAKARKLPKS